MSTTPIDPALGADAGPLDASGDAGGTGSGSSGGSGAAGSATHAGERGDAVARPLTHAAADCDDLPGFLAAIPFLRTLGVEFEGIVEGEVRLAVEIGEHLRNGWQIAHGGVVMALADASLAAAARVAGGGRGLVTVEMKVSFMQPGHARLLATGRVLHRSSTMAFCEGEINDADGQLVAKALGTFKYLRALPVGRRIARERAIHPAPGSGAGD